MIPPELWARLYALDATCNFCLTRHDRWISKGTRRVWRVTIYPRGGRIADGFSVEDERLSEALLIAVDRAEEARR